MFLDFSRGKNIAGSNHLEDVTLISYLNVPKFQYGFYGMKIFWSFGPFYHFHTEENGAGNLHYPKIPGTVFGSWTLIGHF